MSRYPDGTNRFSNSEVDTFRQCRRKWMLSYHMSIRPRVRDVRFPTQTGNVVHGAFEVFYLNGGIHGEDADEKARTFLRELRDTELGEFGPEQHDVIRKAHSVADASFESYLHWITETGIDNNLEILGPEEKLAMPGPLDGTELNGRIDLLARDKITGDIVVIDLKLVTTSIADKIRMLHMDTQAKTYALLAREKFGKPVRVSFRIVKANQRTSKTKGPQEEEYQIHLNDKQLDVYWEQLRGIMGEAIQTSARLDAGEAHQTVCFPSPSSECSWKCDFFGVCPMLDDPLSDAEFILNDSFERKTFNREPVSESDGTLTEHPTDQEVN